MPIHPNLRSGLKDYCHRAAIDCARAGCADEAAPRCHLGGRWRALQVVPKSFPQAATGTIEHHGQGRAARLRGGRPVRYKLPRTFGSTGERWTRRRGTGGRLLRIERRAQ
jgi:hypothetical protein